MKVKLEQALLKGVTKSFRKRGVLLVTCFLLANLTGIYAQTRSITGKVTDATNEPLIGVSILVEGTTNGTITDFDGEYSIMAGNDDVLVFSYIGMQTQMIPVGSSSTINVKLLDDSQMLAETVVIGYGTAKAKDLTSPIASVNAEAVTKHLTTSPMQALQGQISGVQVVSSGQPGSSPKVRIRGAGNFDNDNQGPLYVVDGMLFDNIDFLSNNDIDNISILKDASSAAIYGVRAANGVVLVTTKKGVVNRKPQITYDGYVGFQKASNVMKMANSSEYTTFMREVGDEGILGYINQSVQNWGGNDGIPSVSTDWYKELLKTAVMHSHSIGVTGGGENVSYAVGVSYIDQEGIMDVKNGYQRVNTRGRIDMNITDWLKGGVNFILTNSDQQTNSGNAWLGAYHNPSIYPVYDESMTSEKNPHGYASPQQVGLPNYFWNPYAIADYGKDQVFKRTQILPSYYLEGNFLQNKLTVRTAFSQELGLLRYRQFIPTYDIGGGLGSNQIMNASYLQKRNEFTNNWVWDNTVTYRDSFGQHNFSVMAGNSVRKERWELLRIEGTEVPEGQEEYWYVSNGLQTSQDVNDEEKWADNGTEYRGVSFFGRVMYDYGGRYLLSATLRADGTSKYQSQWGYFPSVGLGWVVSREEFMSDQRVFDFLKIRANWGKLGNDKNKASDGFASINQIQGIFNDSKIPGYTSLTVYSTLKWELTEEYDLGFDFSVLDNRLSGTFDYFDRRTKNAIFAKKLPFGTEPVLVNGGKIQNKGFEVSLNWQDKVNKDFSYNVGLNFTTVKNSVKNLNGLNIMDGNDGQLKKLNQPVDAFYGYKVIGVYQNQAEIDADPIAVANGLVPGDFKYQDTDGDNVLTADDRVILGSHIPKFTLGGNFGFNYKNFDFGVSFQGQFKYQIYNKKRASRSYQSALNIDKDWYKNRWVGEGSTNSYPSALGSTKSWNIGRVNSFFIENASYFSIQNIQLGYTFQNLFPHSNNNSSLRLSLTAERPLNFFSYNGFSTDVANGIDDNVYPSASTFSFGVKFIY